MNVRTEYILRPHNVCIKLQDKIFKERIALILTPFMESIDSWGTGEDRYQKDTSEFKDINNMCINCNSCAFMLPVIINSRLRNAYETSCNVSAGISKDARSSYMYKLLTFYPIVDGKIDKKGADYIIKMVKYRHTHNM